MSKATPNNITKCPTTAHEASSISAVPAAESAGLTRRKIMNALVSSAVTAAATPVALATSQANLGPVFIMELLPPPGRNSDIWSGFTMDASGTRWAFGANGSGHLQFAFREDRSCKTPQGESLWSTEDAPEAVREAVRQAVRDETVKRIHARARSKRSGVARMCKAAEALIDEEKQISNRLSEAHDRAKIILGPVPHEISTHVLQTSPDFDCIAQEQMRQSLVAPGGIIPTWMIESALRHAEGLSRTTIEETEEVITIHAYRKPQQSSVSPEDRQRADRLRVMLRIANDHQERWKAALATSGYTDWDVDPRARELTDEIVELVDKIAMTSSETRGDLLAKLSLYNRDTYRFGDGEPSLAESIIEDIPRLFGSNGLNRAA